MRVVVCGVRVLGGACVCVWLCVKGGVFAVCSCVWRGVVFQARGVSVCEVCGGELWLYVDVCLWLLVVVYGGGLCALGGFRLEILSCGALWSAEFH